MKKEINPAYIVVALAGMLCLIGVLAWRLFGPTPPPPATPEARAEARRWVEAFKSQARQQPNRAPAAPGVGTAPQQTPGYTR